MSDLRKNFFEILKKRNKTYLVFKVLKEMERLLKKDEVLLVLSEKLEKKEVEGIEKSLRKFLGKGKKIKTRRDNCILGGFLAKSSNYLIDASIKGQFEEIKKSHDVPPLA